MVVVSVLMMISSMSAAQSVVRQALEQAEPPPALRAAFTARLSTPRAVREFVFDPHQSGERRVRQALSFGEDPELDRIAHGWMTASQPDVRLFADDVRASVRDGWIEQAGETIRVTFRHQPSSNDGPLEERFSGLLAGEMTMTAEKPRLLTLSYRLEEPVRIDGGLRLNAYNQTYRFEHSDRWGVTYLTAYDLQASGGVLGVAQSRKVSVRITDVYFSLAGDARQEIETRRR